MSRLSRKSLDVIADLNREEVVPADELSPEDADVASFLASEGYLEAHTLVPPGKEKEFYGERGLSGYRSSSRGRESLRLRKDDEQDLKQNAEEKAKERREDKRHSWLQFWLGHLVSFLLGFLSAPAVIAVFRELLGL